MTNKALFMRSNVPGVEELKDENLYTRLLELDFDEMIPFVLSNIRKKGIVSYSFLAVNLIALAGIGIYSIWGFQTGIITWSRFITQLLLGILAGSIVIIPFHELLHGLAYRILGATKIQFGANLQQFIFYVTADRFPVNRIELCFLAMLPFIVVNVCSLMLAIYWMPQYKIFWGFLLFSHNLMCIGDFAITNYAILEKGSIFTYDETGKKKSYFYKRATGKL